MRPRGKSTSGRGVPLEDRENGRRLWFPVMDERARPYDIGCGDMHSRVENLIVPDDVPETAVAFQPAARELLRRSHGCCEFSTVTVMPRWRSRPSCAAGTRARAGKSLHQLIGRDGPSPTTRRPAPPITGTVSPTVRQTSCWCVHLGAVRA